MIKTLVYFYIILITITTGLVLTNDLTAFGAFTNLSEAVNQYRAVGATADVNGLVTSSNLINENDTPNYPGIALATINIGVSIIKIIAFFIVGSIELLDLVDPSYTWGLLLIAPLAVIQLVAFFYLVLEIARTLLGAR